MAIIKLGIIMDPLELINPSKDSTYAMIKEAAKRNWQIFCCSPTDIFVKESIPYSIFKQIEFNSESNLDNWFKIKDRITIQLNNLDIILLRKDPPFNMEYIYLTYILDKLASSKTLVANNPTAVRNNNEKLATLNFPNLTPPNIVTSNKQQLIAFIKEHRTCILKPLDGMGGHSIFKAKHDDDNTSVIIDTITNFGTTTILAQKFIPEISNGDKRILLIDGKAIPCGLARIPAKGEFRGNLAAGAQGIGFELSQNDIKICEEVGPYLKDQGLYFVGIDVIGNYITEINVTSPTCIQEINQAYNLDIAKDLLDCLEKKL